MCSSDLRTARAGAEGIAISLCDGQEVTFLRDIEKLIRMTVPVSDSRANQRRAEPLPATRAIKSPANAKGEHWRGSSLARKQRRHGQPSEAPRGIDAVAFIRSKERPERGRARRAQRWAGRSQGA